MSELVVKIEEISTIANELNNSATLLLTGVKYENKVLTEYFGAVDMLLEEVSSLSDLCKDLVDALA